MSGTKLVGQRLSLMLYLSTVLLYYANDVIDIFIDGSIIVSALPDQPGGPPVQNAFLWEEMRQRLAGEWVLMPSVSNLS